MAKTICFTGKRPKDMYGYRSREPYDTLQKKVCLWLCQIAREGEITHSITGGAQGFDQVAFWACKDAGIAYKSVYLPFYGQERYWAKNGLFGRQEYAIMLLAAEEVRPCTLIDSTSASGREISAAYLKRNHDMVDASDIVLGCLDTRIDFHYDRSGTAATLRYAEAHGKGIFLIDVNSLQVTKYRVP